jgi:hypothetical protein
MRHLRELHRKHEGKDIYVAGSGPSLGYVGDGFLKDKTVICVNHTIDHVIGANLYVISKEPSKKLQSKVKKRFATLVTCEFHSGGGNRKNKLYLPEDTVIFRPMKGSEFHPRSDLTALTVSASTITTAMHLAAYMGAKAIVLMGHDCGMLDGEVHVKNYDKSSAVTSIKNYSEWMHVNSVEFQTLWMKKILEKKWGVDVCSINPFINFRLEGHTYSNFSFPS